MSGWGKDDDIKGSCLAEWVLGDKNPGVTAVQLVGRSLTYSVTGKDCTREMEFQ